MIPHFNFNRQILAGLVFVVSYLSLCLGCPEDAVTRVYACLGNLVGTDGRIKILAGDDAQQFYQKCLDGSFDQTVHCVQSVMTVCRGTVREAELRDTLDPVRMKTAFDAACDTKYHYLQTASCVSRYKHRINTCSKSIQKQFTRAKEEAYSIGKYMDLMCSFLHGITGCTEAPIRRYCDKMTADTIVDFIAGITPVTCVPYRNDATHRTLSVNVWIFMVLWICSFYSWICVDC